MSRQIRCPNCGGEHTLANPGITQVICQYCKTVVYWDDDEVLKQGTQSVLTEGDTRLFMHATGALDGRSFTVVGHVRYDWGQGTWDEWYLQMDDGGVAWISEDERELIHEQATNASGVPPYSQLRIGSQVQIGYPEKHTYSVRELRVATCIGGEGQLPFKILPGERYPYADLATPDGRHWACLEYDEGNDPPTGFIGRPLDHSQLVIHDERPPSTAGAHSGRGITCGNCSGALEVKEGRGSETRVCDYCGAVLDLTAAQARVVGVNPKNFKHGLRFEIGQQATFWGKTYEVSARMLFVDPEGYREREYVLWNADEGYQYLSEEDGHYVIGRPTQQAPQFDPSNLPPKSPILVGDTRYRMFEGGRTTLRYVDGALPWQAMVGDSNRYINLVAPPYMFTVERTEKEVEYSRARYVPHTEVWEAFGMRGDPPRPTGVHPAQPFVRSTSTKLLRIFALLFAAINLGLLIWSAAKDGKELFAGSFTADQYLGRETLSRQFKIGRGRIMSMKISAGLSNSWIYAQLAFVDAKNQAVHEIDGELSYYHGYSGGESWTEGSRVKTVYFRAPKPGTYRFIIKASGGSGNYRGPPRGERINIRLYQGAVLSRYFGIMFGFCLFVAFVIGMRKRLFEGRRWAPVIGDDDD